jgi:type VI secretion system protein ImpM
MDAAGFFGKLPSHGDFVSRRLSRDFLDIWDNWLQRAIAESKASLGDDWLEIYLTSPIWRFALMPGICGTDAYLGLVMPSIDRVGRYFPLTIAIPIPADTSTLGLAIAGARWFDASEQLLLSVLDDDGPDLEAFDRQTEAMTAELSDSDSLFLPEVERTGAASTQWQLSAAADLSPGLAICAIAGGVIRDQAGPLSMWWTSGSEVSRARFVAAIGLPDPIEFASMLGDREEAIPEDWQDVGELPQQEAPQPATLPPAAEQPLPQTGETIGETVSLEALINAPVKLSFSSAAKTDAGKVRRDNEDAVLEKSDQSLWLVADGMGGHAAGKTASAAVVSAIDEMEVPTDIDARIEAVTRALQSVNHQLRSFSEHRPECAGLGSTVAVLIIANGTSAIVWAGDTRVYRKRGQQVEQLTADHSERQERMDRGDINSILGGATNVVTRAIGGEAILQVSTIRQAVHPGDRFLLCSDGVYEELPMFQMAELLDGPDCATACDAIIAAVLEGRAQDNASAIVVDALGE